MTLLVTLSGGVNARLEPSFMVFKNANRSYSIRNVEDDVSGVTSRSSAKGWIDADIFSKWLDKRRIFKPLSNGRTRILFVVNCGAQKLSETAIQCLARSRAELRFFPECATNLFQPADFFMIQAVKAKWMERWNAAVMGRIENKIRTDARERSGCLVNPEKRYFFRLASDVVRESRTTSRRQ